MHSLHCLPVHSKQPLSSLPQLLQITCKYKRPILLFPSWIAYGDGPVFHGQSSSFSSCIVHAVEKDSQQYEVDPEKAREALKELDKQLDALSKKQVSSPKIKASEVELTGDETTGEVTEDSVSFLNNIFIGLFLFTILYNILFYGVIKPSIDGPEEPEYPVTEATVEKESPEVGFLQLLPLIPEVSVQPINVVGD